MADVLYSVRDLTVEYRTRLGPVRAVEGVSLDIHRGEILGLVGESGCGKSTLGKALMRLPAGPARITSGRLLFDGTDLMTLSEREMRKIRGARIGMVFQDPMTSLDPVQRVVDHLTETMLAHRSDWSRSQARARAEELVERLGIRRDRIDDYPHQMSGGMRQRVMISLALALNCDLVIADEPTTSLDVIVEAKFLDLLADLRREFDLTILLITHNIGVVAQIADRVAVMYAGRIAEIGDVDRIFEHPHHPYTQGLLRSVPDIEVDMKELYQMEGSPPNLLHPPAGCRFHPRCPFVMEVCHRETPDLVGGDDQAPTHRVACWLYTDRAVEDAPRV